jgi:hypothetical protein
LVYSFRILGLSGVDFAAFGPVARQKSWQGVHGGSKLLTLWQLRRKEGERQTDRQESVRVSLTPSRVHLTTCH